ncbi:MAG: aminoglycoside phosphotransferase family protein [Desulforhopalus sp.]
MSNTIPPDVLAAFCKEPATIAVTPLGFGNINDTYLVRPASHPFVLQRINNEVFPEPLKVIENFHTITKHLLSKNNEQRQGLQVASPVLTLDKGMFHRDSTGVFWRAQSYLPHKSFRVLNGPGQAREVGKALAKFHRLVSDLDMQKLRDPLPGFHYLPGYLEEYDRELQKLKIETDKKNHSCLAAIERYRQRATTLEDAKRAGILSLQPIHGDPKVDNFFFGDQGEALGLLDLDTVAIGLVHYDLGDCLRSCCNRAGEADRTLHSATFDLELCRALLGGYFSEPYKQLKKEEISFVFDGILLICFELGVRFFTDYLRGNRYFKVMQDDDNLLRAFNQFQLTDDIARQEQEIRVLVSKSGIAD